MENIIYEPWEDYIRTQKAKIENRISENEEEYYKAKKNLKTAPEQKAEQIRNENRRIEQANDELRVLKNRHENRLYEINSSIRRAETNNNRRQSEDYYYEKRAEERKYLEAIEAVKSKIRGSHNNIEDATNECNIRTRKAEETKKRNEEVIFELSKKLRILNTNNKEVTTLFTNEYLDLENANTKNQIASRFSFRFSTEDNFGNPKTKEDLALEYQGFSEYMNKLCGKNIMDEKQHNFYNVELKFIYIDLLKQTPLQKETNNNYTKKL